MLRVLALAFVLAATQAAAAEPPNPAQAAPKKEGKPKLICRDEAPTGTRMVKRKCFTEADWRKRERTAQDSFNELQNSQSGNMEKAG